MEILFSRLPQVFLSSSLTQFPPIGAHENDRQTVATTIALVH